MERNIRALLGGCVIGATGILAFVLGHALSPESYSGRDLISQRLPSSAAVASTPQTGASDASGGLKFSTKVADDNTAGSPPNDYSDELPNDSPGSTFQTVYLLLKHNYVDGVPADTVMAHGAASAMLESLGDPNCRFLEQAEMNEEAGRAQGLFHGLGVLTVVRKITHPGDAKDDIPSYDENRLTIVAPVPGSPSQTAGLLPGDVITEIDGKFIATYDPFAAAAKQLEAAENDPVTFDDIVNAIQARLDASYTLEQAETHLSDPTVKTMTLTIERPGTPQPMHVTVDCSNPTQVDPVTSKTLDSGLGYIKISLITPTCDTEFANDLAGLGPNLKGLVIDLRDCPGGDVETAARIAGHLTTAGTLGYVSLKDRKYVPIPIAQASPVDVPLYVLVNGGTANAAELLASTLGQGGAKLIGARTFGDGAAVRTIGLKDGSGFTMTIGHLFTNDKADFDGKGLAPDAAVGSETDSTADPVDMLKQSGLAPS